MVPRGIRHSICGRRVRGEVHGASFHRVESGECAFLILLTSGRKSKASKESHCKGGERVIVLRIANLRFLQPSPTQTKAAQKMEAFTVSPKWGDLLSRSRNLSYIDRRKEALIYSGRCRNCRIISQGAGRLFGSACKVGRGKKCAVICCSATSGEVRCVETAQADYMVREFGWGVRRMVEDWDEMGRTAYVQAEAFHIPVTFFNDQLFKFFQAEVLSALMYRIRNSPPNRYACLVAEPIIPENLENELVQDIVGVVDVTVQSDDGILKHLDGALEYLYVSGIAVLPKSRRRKVGTVLLKACEELSILWGFEYLVLRAYEDDSAALKLYTGNGYRVVSADPKWTTTWIGRRRRVLMTKRIPLS